MDAKKAKKILYDKKTIRSIYFVSFTLLIVIIALSFVLYPAAFVPGNGGGVPSPTPDPYVPVDPIDPIIPVVPIPDVDPIIPIYPPVPSAPELMNIIPSNDLDGVILLLWTFVYEADNYYLYRSQDGGSYQLVATLPSNTLSYEDTVYESGTYKYKIVAEGIGGSSDFSTEQKVTVSLYDNDTIITPPAEPIELELNIVIGLVITVFVIVFLLILGFLYSRSRKTKKRGN